MSDAIIKPLWNAAEPSNQLLVKLLAEAGADLKEIRYLDCYKSLALAAAQISNGSTEEQTLQRLLKKMERLTMYAKEGIPDRYIEGELMKIYRLIQQIGKPYLMPVDVSVGRRTNINRFKGGA